MRFTFAFVSDVDTCRSSGAGIAIGFAVATTHGIINQDTGIGFFDTHSQAFAVAGFFLAIFALCTLGVGFTSLLFTFTAVGHIDAGRRGCAIVAVGLTVAPTYRCPYRGTKLRFFFALTYAVTSTRTFVAKLTGATLGVVFTFFTLEHFGRHKSAVFDTYTFFAGPEIAAVHTF